MSDTSYSTKKEWKGVMIGCINLFDDYHEVPGWECPDCGWRLGMLDYPNFPCPKCGFHSSQPKVTEEE